MEVESTPEAGHREKCSYLSTVLTGLAFWRIRDKALIALQEAQDPKDTANRRYTREHQVTTKKTSVVALSSPDGLTSRFLVGFGGHGRTQTILALGLSGKNRGNLADCSTLPIKITALHLLDSKGGLIHRLG